MVLAAAAIAPPAPVPAGSVGCEPATEQIKAINTARCRCYRYRAVRNISRAILRGAHLLGVELMFVADMAINRCRTTDTPRNARQLRRPAAAIPATAESCCVESITEWKTRCDGHLTTASSTVIYRITDRRAASGNNNSGWAFSGGVPMGNNSNGGFPTQIRQLGGGVSFAQSLGGSQPAAPLDLSYVL